MRNCGWYLWLNGKKIYNIRALRENFDTAVLSGYFLGGSLMKWLSDLGEFTIIKRLNTIDLNGDIGSQLEFAFGVSPDKKAPANTEIKPLFPPSDITLTASEAGLPEILVYSGSFFGNGIVSSFTPLSESSFSAYSEAVSSFESAAGTSFTSLIESSFGVFAFGENGNASSFGLASSYSAFITGQALNMTQSSGGSYSFGNLFGLSETFGSAGFMNGGSFRSFWWLSKWISGSYKGIYAGSFLPSLLGGGSFPLSSGFFGSGNGLGAFFASGSFTYTVGSVTITAEEYRRTLINLSSCPLNAYGYGINLV